MLGGLFSTTTAVQDFHRYRAEVILGWPWDCPRKTFEPLWLPCSLLGFGRILALSNFPAGGSFATGRKPSHRARQDHDPEALQQSPHENPPALLLGQLHQPA